jgi:hypothetical protein
MSEHGWSNNPRRASLSVAAKIRMVDAMDAARARQSQQPQAQPTPHWPNATFVKKPLPVEWQGWLGGIKETL